MKNKMILIVALAIFVIGAFGVYQYEMNKQQALAPEEYKESFESFNPDEWFVGQWDGYNRHDELINVTDGIMTIETQDDIIPYVLYKPIEIKTGDVITVIKKMRVTYTNDRFNGGSLYLQTDQEKVAPENITGDWEKDLGDAALLVEYVHNYDDEQLRPGKDVFRVLPATWMSNNNYELLDPIYGEWFIETTVFDTRSNIITYSIEGKVVRSTKKVDSLPFDKQYLRVMMHPFGQEDGQKVEIDDMKITIEHTDY